MHTDSLRTEEFMTMEADNLVFDMLSSSSEKPHPFEVGGKLDSYRRIFREVIERHKCTLLDETPELVSFRRPYGQRCTIRYTRNSR